MISIKKDTVEVTIVNDKPVIDKLSIDRKKKHKYLFIIIVLATLSG